MRPERVVVSKVFQLEELLLRSRRLPWAVWAMALAVLALAIVLTARPVRGGIRDQMIQRDGEILQAVLAARMESVLEEGIEDDPTDPAAQLSVLLSISRLEGVLGIRLFDTEGRFVDSFPPTLRDHDLPTADLQRLRTLRPVSRYRAAARIGDQFYPERDPLADLEPGAPLLTIGVPLHLVGLNHLYGAAEFVVDGEPMRVELQRLDARMLIQGFAIFLVGGVLLTGVLGWSFRRLQRLHGQLAERTDSLLRANAELGLAARTAALGAISAHLVHGLRSPLAGLRNLVANGASHCAVPAPEDWAQAAASMRRMQNLINEVAQVLREHAVGDRYQVSYEELSQLVATRVAVTAQTAGVRLEVKCRATGVLGNRAANLVALILANLLENALQASPAGKRVELLLLERSGCTLCRICDQGSGIPDSLLPSIFSPVVSTKEGGSGLGLAISRQLAQYLGARLELVETGPNGSVFELAIPSAREQSQTASASAVTPKAEAAGQHQGSPR